MRRRGTQNKTETKKNWTDLEKKEKANMEKVELPKKRRGKKKLCWKPAITPCPWEEREKK